MQILPHTCSDYVRNEVSEDWGMWDIRIWVYGFFYRSEAQDFSMPIYTLEN